MCYNAKMARVIAKLDSGKKRKRKIARLFLARIFVAGVVLSVLGLVVFIAMVFSDLPDPSSFYNRAVHQSTRIYDRTGEILLFEAHGAERRTVVPLENIPMHKQWATLAAEDINFYQHPGFDLRGIGRALWHNLTREEGEGMQGGSTITQQLVKNIFFEPDQSILRKARELIVSIAFEHRYSKDQILEFYLNQIPYGSNVYGVEAAAQHYFTKSAAELTLTESATLAAMIRAPSFYAANPDHLAGRVAHVLNRMAGRGWITFEEAEIAIANPISLTHSARVIRAPHFVMHIKQLLEQRYGRATVQNEGLRVITTIDMNLQQIAENAVASIAVTNETRYRAANIALIAIDPNTGQVLTMVGSRNFFGSPSPAGCVPGRTCTFDPQVNVAMRPRQPGSAFKPFVYYNAFRVGYSPSTILFDVSTEFSVNCNASSIPLVPGAICYRPQNFDGSWRGPISIRRALAQSLNIPAVKALYLTGIEEALATARNFGITALDQSARFYGLPLALGGGAIPLNELAHAYTVLASDGIYRPQAMILRVEDARGNVLEEFIDQPRRVADAQSVRLINDVLADSPARSPIFAPGSLDVEGYRVAVKTGTSQDFIDGWSFGYTPSLVVGVWGGNSNNAPMTPRGAGLAAATPTMRTFMAQALAMLPQSEFPSASDVVLPEKPMLSGQYVVWGADGSPTVHSILHFVDRKDPLGPAPLHPYRDPQYTNWEAAVRFWWDFYGRRGDFPMPVPPPAPVTRPQILISTPSAGAVLPSREVRLEFAIHNFNPQRVLVTFNGRDIARLDPSSDNTHALLFIPANWREGGNEIRISAINDAQQITETVVVQHAPTSQ